jgi:hypothetical protein
MATAEQLLPILQGMPATEVHRLFQMVWHTHDSDIAQSAAVLLQPNENQFKITSNKERHLKKLSTRKSMDDKKKKAVNAFMAFRG